MPHFASFNLVDLGLTQRCFFLLSSVILQLIHVFPIRGASLTCLRLVHSSTL